MWIKIPMKAVKCSGNTEYEIEGLRADLVLLPNHVTMADNYYVFEVKYLKKKEDKSSKLHERHGTNSRVFD